MSTEELICRSCGLVTSEPQLEQIPLRTGGHHLKASCPDCGAFIKFLSHSEPSLFFGKYKGKTLREIAQRDASYLRWLFEQDIKPKLKSQISEALKAQG